MSKKNVEEKDTKLNEELNEVNIERPQEKEDTKIDKKKAKKAKKELTPLEEKELEIATLKAELEEARQAENEAKDQLLRKVAEIENFRKRLDRKSVV